MDLLVLPTRAVTVLLSQGEGKFKESTLIHPFEKAYCRLFASWHG